MDDKRIVQIPKHLLQSREWLAALLLLQNTTLNEFFNTDYVDVRRQTIGSRAMIAHATTDSQIFLSKLLAHLFNAYTNDMPAEGMFSLDDHNLKYAFLAMMTRYGVHPLDIAGLLKAEING